MIDHIGQQLGHYRIIRKLGSGGFADVYQVEHIYLNTPAAVKLLNANLASWDIQNFHNEAKTIARLVHPHIVRILDFGIEASVPYLVMEYAPNGTMRQRYPKGTMVPLPLVMMYVKQIASALQYAHTQRLIHRDVKPENLLLGRDNGLLLGDFGAALLTHTSSMLSTQNVIGTISYMAPEQLEGKPMPASDQYALGIVAYEWLCGHCPFQGTLAEVHNLQLYGSPPSLRAKIPTLSPAVEYVIMKALAKRHEQRFASVQAFAEALEQASVRPQASPGPLYLAASGGTQGYAPALATEAILAPSPLPPTIAVPPPVQPLFETIMREAPRPTQKHLSRRVFVGSLIGLTVIGGSGVLALVLAQQGEKLTSAAPPGIATPIPIKKALYTYTGHQDEVFTAAWSSDDTYIASAGGNIDTRQGDIGVHVWAAQTGQDVYVYPGHAKLVRMVAWSPRGARIASASEDSTVQVWDASSGNNPLIYKGHTGQVLAVAWSPDGTQIASAGMDQIVQVWDAGSGQLKISYTGHTKAVTSIAWSLNGKFIASASKDGAVYVWDAASGTTLASFPHKAWVGGLAWSADSTSIVTGDYNPDDSVRIWNISTGTGKSIFSDASANPVDAVAWSPDGKFIAAGYDKKQVKIWRLAPTEQVLTYTGHSGAVLSVQWNHKGNYLASGSFDRTVQIWTLS